MDRKTEYIIKDHIKHVKKYKNYPDAIKNLFKGIAQGSVWTFRSMEAITDEEETIALALIERIAYGRR